jgi:hypothetical protein
MGKICENELIPEQIHEEAQKATLDLLLWKSKDAYEKVFVEFNNWKEKNGVKGAINKEVLLAYFYNVNKKFAVSSMWTKFSMLKATLKVHRNIDISKYSKLIAFLKSKSRTYKPKKAKILESEHIKQFLKGAPDEKYLMVKVIVVICVCLHSNLEFLS